VCVALARSHHETPINHGALMHDQVVLFQEDVEFIEQLTETGISDVILRGFGLQKLLVSEK
jgi:hypothetical protein